MSARIMVRPLSGAVVIWEDGMTISALKTALFCATAFGVAALAAPASAQEVGACLITKTDTNPFFVKMKEGATAKAQELGVTLKSYAGRIDGDSESQVEEIVRWLCLV